MTTHYPACSPHFNARAPTQTNLLIARDRFFAHWEPIPICRIWDKVTDAQADSIAWSANDLLIRIGIRMDEYKGDNFNRNEPPYRQLYQAFNPDCDDLHFLPEIKIKSKTIEITSKNMHIQNTWNGTTTLKSLLDLDLYFTCPTIFILSDILEYLLEPEMDHSFIQKVAHGYRSPQCDYIDVSHLPYQHMLNSSWASLIMDNEENIDYWVGSFRGLSPMKITNVSPHKSNLTPRQLLHAIIATNWNGDWPRPEYFADKFAKHLTLSYCTKLFDIFVQKPPWTNDLLRRAAPPGAWLADCLHTCLLGIFNPGSLDKQYWVKNDVYVRLYDYINEELINLKLISRSLYHSNASRSTNNKGNSMELLALHLWDQAEHLLLFTMIVLCIFLNEATKEWAPVGTPAF